MMEQIRTVAWKEWKALGDQAGIRGGGGIVVLTLIALIMGAFMPWTAGPEFFTSPLTLFVYPFIGASVAANPVIDSFAGEKERRTLETLLASPLEEYKVHCLKSSELSTHLSHNLIRTCTLTQEHHCGSIHFHVFGPVDCAGELPFAAAPPRSAIILQRVHLRLLLLQQLDHLVADRQQRASEHLFDFFARIFG